MKKKVVKLTEAGLKKIVKRLVEQIENQNVAKAEDSEFIANEIVRNLNDSSFYYRNEGPVLLFGRVFNNFFSVHRKDSDISISIDIGVTNKMFVSSENSSFEKISISNMTVDEVINVGVELAKRYL